ncbi:hypothetical protein [Isoptericola nanjingensis]|uniref:hypothetical protein n=1 Tax=Isoptericola TaxID=254250 RepID=UPI003D1C4464|nr:hypothetical protein [Isoptericola sp. QY 916]
MTVTAPRPDHTSNATPASRTGRVVTPADALAAGDQTALVAALSDLVLAAWRRRRARSRRVG